jgi:hypothetical protein
VTVDRTMPVRDLIISLERWLAFLTSLSYTPDNSLAIVTPDFNGTNGISCIPSLFGEHMVPKKHGSRIRILAPDPTRITISSK